LYFVQSGTNSFNPVEEAESGFRIYRETLSRFSCAASRLITLFIFLSTYLQSQQLIPLNEKKLFRQPENYCKQQGRQ
ncbi:hypothetical protein, partial [Chryseobacterium indoltheticum]|uniref:hypothetical protein n=1 Tax=Chryseobacterium indoltheticum TaxID=254 RepID=UPI003F494A0B